MKCVRLVILAMMLTSVASIRIPNGMAHKCSLLKVGRERSSPPQPMPSGNATAAYALLRRDFLLFERLSMLLWRTATRSLAALRDWVGRSVGFPPRVMVVSLSGVISADDEVSYGSQALMDDAGAPLLLSADGGFKYPKSRGGRQGAPIINLERCEKQLERAFAAHGARAVCVVINSPGGSPAQSSLIYQRLRALRKRYKHIPLYAFVEDAAVSGGYYIACAADQMCVTPSSTSTPPMCGQRAEQPIDADGCCSQHCRSVIARRIHRGHLERLWICESDQEARDGKACAHCR